MVKHVHTAKTESVLVSPDDFYESFDDARKVADARSIALSARDIGAKQRVPLAGVPYHALETYLARIMNAGHKVAIVEQTSDEAING